jgi:excisionase family DNA binding protein
MHTIQLQLSVTVGDDAEKAIASLLQAALNRITTGSASDFDERREARLRASRNAILAGEKLPDDQGLLIDSRQAAKLLNVSPRTLWAMQKSRSMLPPIRIGRAVRWSLEALKKWIEAGCPKPDA